MPTPTKGPRLGAGPAHERLMLANLATSLFEHDRITTTEAKAKRLRPLAERLITFAKRGDLHARRQVMTVIRDKDVVHKLFAEIGPKFADASGRLHPHRQDQPAQGRQRPDGDHRARRGAEVGRGRGRAGSRHQGPRRRRRRPAGPRRSPRTPRPSRRPRPRSRRDRRADRDRGRRGRAEAGEDEGGLAALGLSSQDDSPRRRPPPTRPASSRRPVRNSLRPTRRARPASSPTSPRTSRSKH